MHNRPAKVILTAILLIPLTVSGQLQVNSPFARYNLGIIEPAGSFRSLGMGGTSIAMKDNSSVYFQNPASYSAIDTNSFIFDFGIDYGMNTLSDGSSRHFSGDLNFDHLLMGFPISRKIGVATGLYNRTNGYYKLTQNVTQSDPGYDPVTGEYTTFHVGSGGLTSFFLGTGISLTKNLSAGANMSLLFGRLKRSNEIDFSDYYHEYNDNTSESLQITGLNFDLGLRATVPLKNDYFLNGGISLSTGSNYKSKYERIAYRFNAFGAPDTLPGSYILDDSTRAYIPGTLRIGLAFGKKNKFTAAADLIMTNWSKAKIRGSAGYLANTQALHLGLEYIPDKFSNYSYLKRMEYRIGGHIGNNYLVINGTQVKELGVTCGLSIPMRLLSKTTLYFDYTRKSYSGPALSHFENYFSIGASLNLYAWWFVKNKYD